ncbi:MAG: trigger factor [Bdellovibrionales bacterium]|nr:trigger factor [Bdellovibrionales bacterium]
MKVDIENLQGHFKKVTIEMPADRVAKHADEYYKRLQKDVELKGFRKGKAPLDMVRSLYADSAQQRIARELVELGFRDAVAQHSLAPVNTPDINVETFSELSGLKFTATFENTPPVILKNYTSFKAEKKEAVVPDADIEKTIQSIQSQMSSLEDMPADTVVGTHDVVQMDYEGSEAGKPVLEATDKNALFELGAGYLAPDFEKNVVGLKAGDTKNFSVKFPEAKTEEEQTPVAGKTIDFSIKVLGVKKKILPELNDAFAAKVGPFKSLTELKARIAEDMKREQEQKLRREQLDKAVEWLIQENPVEAPETMIAGQMEQLAVDAGMQLQRMGLDEKAIEERLKGWGDQMTERATKQVKASLLLSSIAEKENIKASDDDVRNEISKMAMQARKSPKDVWEDLQKKGLVYGLVRQITELKALDFVVDKAS